MRSSICFRTNAVLSAPQRKVVAALIGAAVVREAFPLSSVAGMILIIGGSWFATRANMRHDSSPAQRAGLVADMSNRPAKRPLLPSQRTTVAGWGKERDDVSNQSNGLDRLSRYLAWRARQLSKRRPRIIGGRPIWRKDHSNERRALCY